MLLDAAATFGTIGGGQLEWAAMTAARQLLSDETPVRLAKLVLGTELAQCCGGVVELWIERYTRADTALLRSIAAGRGTLVSTWQEGRLERRVLPMASPLRWQSDPAAIRAELWEPLVAPVTPLWLYGAGHVGQALVRVLESLPFAITWIDARVALLPDSLSSTVQVIAAPDPAATVRQAPTDAMFLVMTHSHPLDYALCHAVLDREDVAWLGLIGSHSKAARFRSRLTADGVPRSRIERLVSPIGIPGIDSKLPAAIAVAVAAQLLEWQSAASRTAVNSSVLDPASGCAGCASASRGC
jgi:xanthine dehydrogenase accessory factor